MILNRAKKQKGREEARELVKSGRLSDQPSKTEAANKVRTSRGAVQVQCNPLIGLRWMRASGREQLDSNREVSLSE
jgi:hypothetical protein